MTDADLRRLGRDRRPLASVILERRATEAAPALLGILLVRREPDGGETVVRLVETEAYRESDPASHAYRGRRPSTASMFGPVGLAYVYFTYGMHWCLNVSCEGEGVGAAVLVRAAVCLCGRRYVRARRGSRHAERDLLRGPARLTEGLGIDREWDGTDLLDPASPLRLEDDGWRPSDGRVRAGPRTGVRTGADVPWRYWLDDVPEVSRYVRHPRAEEAGTGGADVEPSG